MKIVQFAAFGLPHEVAACVGAPDPAVAAADDVLVEVEAFPINPADLLTLNGSYAVRPPLPARLGAEGVGRVKAVGSAVDNVAPGDRVVLMCRENWVQQRLAKAAEVVKVPADVDPLQLAMLKVNPATALLMLRNYRTFEPGDWVIQNAANSAVGTSVISIAKAQGLRTLNVVRRDALAPALSKLGADVVLVDGADLAERARAAAGEGAALAIDAVGGDATLRLAACLREGSTVINYGLLSGRPCQVGSADLIFRGITLTGFWLLKALGAMTAAARDALYGELVDMIQRGELAVTVEATYDIDDIQRALAHAAREGRSGKILVTPNGPL